MSSSALVLFVTEDGPLGVIKFADADEVPEACVRTSDGTEASLEALGKEEVKAIKALLKNKSASIAKKARVAMVTKTDASSLFGKGGCVTVFAKSGGVGKPKKKKKGPPRPKSAYMLFCDARRAAVTAELKQAAEANGTKYENKEVMKTLGSEWKQLAEGEKEQYTKAAASKKQESNEEGTPAEE